MDESRITELRALADSATPPPWNRAPRGPWIDGGENGYDEVIAPAAVECMAYCYGGSSRIELSDADAAFIAAARTAIPELLDALAEAMAERDRYSDLFDTAHGDWNDEYEAHKATKAERDRLAAVVERVRALAEQLTEQGDHHVPGCMGQADCAACVQHDLFAALDGEDA